MFFIIFSILVAIAAGFAFYFGRAALRRRKIKAAFGLKLYLVRLPRGLKEGKNLKEEINLNEQLFGTLTNFKKPFVFEVAVPHVGEEIHFFVAVDEAVSAAFIREIQSLWNDADIRAADDYNVFNYSGPAEAVFFSLKERFILPIRTYGEVGADTFLPVLGGFAKINEVGEGGALQIIVRPASRESRYRKEVRSAIKSLKKGSSISDLLRPKISISAEEVREALGGRRSEEKKQSPLDEQAIKALEFKLSKPFFEVNIRAVAGAGSEFQAMSILQGITAGFSQFAAPERNGFKAVKPKNVKELLHRFSFREWSDQEKNVLNSEELASIFHFPTPFTEIPKIKELKAKEAPPPANLPATGILLGQSHWRGEMKEVRIADDDRRRHVYLIGQTGTGKSNLLINMAKEDIESGKGVAVLDPHGDFIGEILGLVPKKRFDDVIVFEPGALDRPLGLNMIEYDPRRPEEKTFIVNEMQGIFNKLFSQETMGPMFEQYMRNALLLLMEDAPNEPATLMEVSRVFTDLEFRTRKLARIKNPAVYDFWQKEAVKAGGEAALQNITPYITSKFNNFTANDYMRVIIGQVKSAFNFREVMDQRKILLVNLSKGKIGDINANLLGMIVVGKLLMAALGRVDAPEEKRPDFHLYIDEFQNFTTDSIAVILSEARKYHLNLIIAHQFIGQLNDKIKEAVFGNVGSIVSFRVGAQDAEFLKKQFEPTFSERDLINIDNFNACVKLLINGETSKPFNIKTLPAEAGDRRQVALLTNLSAERYGRDRTQVEEEIMKRLRE